MLIILIQNVNVTMTETNKHQIMESQYGVECQTSPFVYRQQLDGLLYGYGHYGLFQASSDNTVPVIISFQAAL